jgi:hypothetical protein
MSFLLSIGETTMAGAVRMAGLDPGAAKEEVRLARLADRPAAARSGELQQRAPLLERDGGIELIERRGGS